MQELGKILIVAGVILLCAGTFFIVAPKVPFLGKLPGDIIILKKNVTLYFPLATSLVISMILSLFFWLWSRR
jgi:hypothetical protein